MYGARTRQGFVWVSGHGWGVSPTVIMPYWYAEVTRFVTFLYYKNVTKRGWYGVKERLRDYGMFLKERLALKALVW